MSLLGKGDITPTLYNLKPHDLRAALRGTPPDHPSLGLRTHIYPL